MSENHPPLRPLGPVLLLERFSQMLGQPLQIGKGGLREGIILTLLNGNENGATIDDLCDCDHTGEA